ncbi:MAG: hypothetical protein AB7Q16_10505 [Vicinamibacterales bacterium]
MKHALRTWRRHPLLAGAAIVSLALGIGANTAIFSVLNAVVLRPLPFSDADRLVMAWETSADNPTRWVAPAPISTGHARRDRSRRLRRSTTSR